MPPEIVNCLIILVVVNEEPEIVAVGNDMFVTAGDELPDKSVKNGFVDNAGGSELISNVTALLLSRLHNTLATVPDLNSDTGARLFRMLAII